jgi:hypothetical protein
MTTPSLVKSNKPVGRPSISYIPPNIAYKSPSEILLPPGRYYKAGYRSREYPEISSNVGYWDVPAALPVNISGSYSPGVSPGFVGGKVANSWNSVFLVGNTSSDVMVLPMIKISNCNYDPQTDTTTISVTDHESGGYVNLAPLMTSDTTPSPYVTSASSVWGSGYEAWRAFDRSTGAQGWHAGNGSVLPQWIKIDMGSALIIDSYRLGSRYDGGQWVTAWQFQGSNDNSNWDILDSRSGIPNPGGGVFTSYYIFSSSTAYRYYRVYCTALSQTYAAFSEIEFYKTISSSFITLNDQFNTYRAVKVALDGSDGAISTVVDTVDGVSDNLVFSGSHVVPEERYGVGYCTDSVNNVMYVFGGVVFTQMPAYVATASGTTGDSLYYPNDIWEYDLVDKKWARLVTTGGSMVGRAYSTLVYDSVNNALLLFGGANSAGTNLNDLWKLTLSNNTWTQLSPTGGPPAIRQGHAACYDAPSQCMYVLAGQGASYLNDVWRYSIQNNTWTQMTVFGSAPSIRGYFAFGVSPAREIYLFGGYDGTTTYNQLYKYSIPGNSWTTLSPPSSPPTRRGGPLVYNPTNNCFYMQGGYISGSSPSMSDFWIYSITNNTWTQLSSATGPIFAQAGAYYNNKIVGALGHQALYRKHRSDTWEYDVLSGQWTRINCGLELKKGDFIQLVPPANVPCLYLGCIRIDSSGNLQKFIKRGWVYRWYAGVIVPSYKATGGSPPDLIGTYSGNTYIGVAVPPNAVSAYLGALVGDYGSTSTSGCASILYTDEGIVQVFNEYNWETSATWKVFETPVNWTFCSVQSIRNQHYQHNYGTQSIPQDAYFRFAGFEE